MSPPVTSQVEQDTLNVGRSNEAARAAWIKKTLADIPAHARILDAGAGEQPFRTCCSHLRYVSQDFAQYRPANNPAGLHSDKWDYGRLDHVCDITAIPEPSASFDAIMCTEVLEHLPDPLAALREFSRLLRPAGTLILTAPFASLTHFAPHHYATGLSRYWYEKHLPENHFRIEELTPNGNWFEYLAQEIRRTSQISSRYANLLPEPDDKLAMKRLLQFLQRCSDADNGSHELLCFGYHLRATRVGNL